MKKTVIALLLVLITICLLQQTEAAPIKVQIGFENTMQEPIGRALEKWKEIVDKKSNGGMVIEIFPNSALGSKNELIDQMLLGEPVITLADGAFYADYGVTTDRKSVV